MKLSKELITAVREVCRNSRRTRDSSYVLTSKRIADFLKKHPVIARQRIEANKVSKALGAQIGRLEERFRAKYGLPLDGEWLSCEKTFVKAGGAAHKERAVYHEAGAIARLAQATPQAGAAFLRELGINWNE